MEQYEVAILDQKVKDRFLETVGENTWNKEVIFAIQAMHGSPALQKCSPMSIKSAVVNIALTGATLNPVLQQAFLIPRDGKCCLDFGYRGLCKIATDAGGVIDVDATVVYEKDVFDYEMGLCPQLKHKPCLEMNRGEMVFVYAIAILPDNIKKFIVLPKSEIEEIKKTSKALKSSFSPWKGAFEAEMWRKSAVKKLYKYLPQTERMSTAVHVLNQHEGLKKDEFSTATELMERFEDVPEITHEDVKPPETSSELPKNNPSEVTSEITKNQVFAIRKILNAKGITDDCEQCEMVTGLAELPEVITKIENLSKKEASIVIGKLQE